MVHYNFLFFPTCSCFVCLFFYFTVLLLNLEHHFISPRNIFFNFSLSHRPVLIYSICPPTSFCSTDIFILFFLLLLPAARNTKAQRHDFLLLSTVLYEKKEISGFIWLATLILHIPNHSQSVYLLLSVSSCPILSVTAQTYLPWTM